MEEEGGISWPLEEGSETNPNSCFPTHTDSKNSLYLSISKLHGPGPKKVAQHLKKAMGKIHEEESCIFRPRLHAPIMVASKS